jgi:hypothetical protein
MFADWCTVYLWVQNNQCFERRRTGTCSCHRKRQDYNPCEREAQILEDLTCMSIGEPSRYFTLDEIIVWVKQHTCRKFPRCNHKSCQDAAPILAFLEQQTMRKAA